MLEVWVRVKLTNRGDYGRAFAQGRAGMIMAGPLLRAEQG